MELTRRTLIKAAFTLAAVSAVPSLARATLSAPVRSLHFYNTHTGESLNTVYWEEGEYLHEALENINYILRDHRTNDMKSIDPHLLDMLAQMHRQLDSKKPFEVISGYRSLRTNAMLHAHSHGVASKSLHLQGKAIDIRLSDRSLSSVRKAAWAMQQGGVGYYPASDFVHIDTGRLRRW